MDNSVMWQLHNAPKSFGISAPLAIPLKLRWKRTFKAKVRGADMHAIPGPGMLFLPQQNRRLIGIDLAKGTLKWIMDFDMEKCCISGCSGGVLLSGDKSNCLVTAAGALKEIPERSGIQLSVLGNYGREVWIARGWVGGFILDLDSCRVLTEMPKFGLGRLSGRYFADKCACFLYRESDSLIDTGTTWHLVKLDLIEKKVVGSVDLGKGDKWWVLWANDEEALLYWGAASDFSKKAAEREGLDNSFLRLIRLSDFSTVWQKKADAYEQMVAVLSEAFAYYRYDTQKWQSSGLVAISRKTGEVLWTRKIGRNSEISCGLGAMDQLWYATNALMALDGNSGNTTYNIKPLERFWHLTGAIDNCLILEGEKTLYCFEDSSNPPTSLADSEAGAEEEPPIIVVKSAGRPPKARPKTKIEPWTEALLPDGVKKLKQPDLDSAGKFVEALKKTGWFADLPKGAEEVVSKRVAAEIKAGNPPWHGLLTVIFDPEITPGEEAYAETLAYFERGSFGLFAPEEIEEEWCDEVLVSLKLKGKPYKRSFVDCEDYIDGSIHEWLNQIMGKARLPVRFFCLDAGGGQEMTYACTSPGAFKKAVKAKLVPDEPKESEAEE